MEIFKIENEMPILNPEMRMIEAFKSIISRDAGSKGDAQARKKSMASKELAFVYFKYHPSSSFVELYKGKELDEMIKKHLGLAEDWMEDDMVKKAGVFFKEINKTISIKTLETARNSLFMLNDLFARYQDQLENAMREDVSLETEEDRKREDERINIFVKSAKELVGLINLVPKSLETLETLKAKYEKELENKGADKKNAKKIEDTELPGFLG
jgi:hypothetical protein